MGKGGMLTVHTGLHMLLFKNNHMHLAVQKSIWFSYTVNSGKQ